MAGNNQTTQERHKKQADKNDPKFGLSRYILHTDFLLAARGIIPQS
jgi:hypothetical protein